MHDHAPAPPDDKAKARRRAISASLCKSPAKRPTGRSVRFCGENSSVFPCTWCYLVLLGPTWSTDEDVAVAWENAGFRWSAGGLCGRAVECCKRRARTI